MNNKSKIHHFHEHGDVELLSSEGMIFRVPSYRFTEICPMIAKLTQAGDTDATTGMKRKALSNEPLKVSISSNTLEKFLDIISVMEPQPPKLDFKEIWAGKMKNIEMAKKALERMTFHTFFYPEFMENSTSSTANFQKEEFWSALNKLPNSWKQKLLRLVISPPNRSYRIGESVAVHTSNNWYQIAELFDPED